MVNNGVDKDKIGPNSQAERSVRLLPEEEKSGLREVGPLFTRKPIASLVRKQEVEPL